MYCDDSTHKCRPRCYSLSVCRINEYCDRKTHKCHITEPCPIGHIPIIIPSTLKELNPVCKKGKICKNGICEIPECVKDGDCKRKNEFCKRDGTCDLYCSKTEECREGHTCISGSCKVECKKIEDCTGEEVCDTYNDEGSICLPIRRCVHMSECGNKKICGSHNIETHKKKYCYTPKKCASSFDCNKYEECKGNACVGTRVCLKHRDCPSKHCFTEHRVCKPSIQCISRVDCLHSDEFCNADNVCQKKTPGPLAKTLSECRANRDCSGGNERCKNGGCVAATACRNDGGMSFYIFFIFLNIRI